MRTFLLILGFVALPVLFQNCGQTARQQTLFLEDTVDVSSFQCEGPGCFQRGDLLWVLIREYEPYRVDITSLSQGHFTVGGQCGIGSFEDHSIIWEFREGFGAQNVVGRGSSENRCDLGQFQIAILPNVGNLIADRRYQLVIEIVGIGEDGEVVTNPNPASKAALDVIFEAP